MDLREIITLIPLVILIFLIGLQPGILLSYMHVSIDHLLGQVNVESLEVYDSITFFSRYLKELFGWV